MRSSEVFVGLVLDKLTILQLVYLKGRLHAKCSCVCGAVKTVRVGHLGIGKTQSCGCGLILKSTTHGQSKGKLYGVWSTMVSRCTNPKAEAYLNYGARGITVSQEWLTFEGFLADMGHPTQGLTLERLDNSKGYSKDNCVWASRAVQSRNTRRNIFIYHCGKGEMVLKDACALLGKDYMAVYRLISRKKLSPSQALDSTMFKDIKETLCV